MGGDDRAASRVMPRALAIAQPCLDRPSTDSWTTNVVSNVVRFGHWKAGNLQALYATPWIPYSIEEDQRNVFASVYRLCLLGHAEMQQMHFALAERYFTESMQLAERHAGPKSISAALCAPMIAQIWYEQGRLDEAEALLVDLMPVIDLAVLLDSTLIAYRVLVRIAIARSDAERAYALLDQAQTLGYARRWDRMIAGVLVEHAGHRDEHPDAGRRGAHCGRALLPATAPRYGVLPGRGALDQPHGTVCAGRHPLRVDRQLDGISDRVLVQVAELRHGDGQLRDERRVNRAAVDDRRHVVELHGPGG